MYVELVGARTGGANGQPWSEAAAGSGEGAGKGGERSSPIEQAATLPAPITGAPPSPWRAARLPVADPESYEVVEVLAQGGIGRILRAYDRRLDRPVAIKELLVEQGSPEEARLVREALLTARLQHPSIVPLYEAGCWPSGKPFYTMKLVSGLSLEELLGQAGSLDERLALMPHVLAVAEAMAYAHTRRIIHRDLKPANVLVGEFGETVVVDWGLAKDLKDEPASLEGGAGSGQENKLTARGAVMGTPAYMAPEQALGDPVDERADVYALGALLYHVLAGCPPYGDLDPQEALRQVRAGPPPPLAQRQEGVPQELLAIVGKAMAQAAANRYPTAREMAEELRRFQTSRIVASHNYALSQRLRRLLRRHRAALAVATAAIVLLVTGAALSVRSIVAARDGAERRHREAEEAQRRATERADELTIEQARSLATRDPNRALALLQGLSPSFPRRGVARMIAADALAQGVARVFRHPLGVSGLAVSPDGRSLVTASDDRRVRIIDLATGKARSLIGHTDEVYDVIVSADGTRLATAGKDATIRLWDLQTGAGRVVAERAARVAAASADLRLIAFSRPGAGLVLLDTTGGLERALCQQGQQGQQGQQAACAPLAAITAAGDRVAYVEGQRLIVEAVGVEGEGADKASRRSHAGQAAPPSVIAFSPAGDRVATGAADGAVRVWDVATGAVRAVRIWTGHTAPITALAFSPDGRSLASGSRDRSARHWDVASGASRVLTGHDGAIGSLAFSPDGAALATASLDRSVRLWDLGTGEGRALHGFQNTVSAVAFLLDGYSLVASSFDGTVRLWDRRAFENPTLSRHAGAVVRVAWSPDGQRVASAGEDGEIRTAAAVAQQGDARVQKHPGGALDLQFAPDGAWLASAGRDGAIRLWSATGGAPVVLRGHDGPVLRIAYSPDGKALASAGADRTVRRWNPASGEGALLFPLRAEPRFLAFSSDGRRLTAGGGDDEVWLWDEGGGAARELQGHSAEVLGAAFSPDGRMLASASRDHTVRLWNLEGGGARASYVAGTSEHLAFLPDGARLLVAGGGSAIGVLDVGLGALRGELRGHNGPITAVVVSRDGRCVASGSADHAVRLWDAASGEGRVLGEHGGEVRSVAFSPDGRAVLSGGADGAVRLWRDDLPRDPGALRAWLGQVVKMPEELGPGD